MRIATIDDLRKDREELSKRLSSQLSLYSLGGEIFEYNNGK